ncbi:phage tail protein I [Psychrobacillus sp.]|uniref:phage tail protein I n=1 Tax=Psychrobacillus sp. TaxID=1871623 RepID=UPI0028BEC009|nr:phage tail protein I [Psychrobacillus sp.]
MNKLDDLSILSILPSSIKHDKDIIAAAKSLDNSTSRSLVEARKLDFFVNPNLTDNKLLDIVAADLHVDFYDSSYPIEIKQKLINESMIIHMEKGTGKAVEDLINAVFGDGEVEEWFEYGGEPFHFRVITSNQSVTNERAQEFIRALNSVKKRTAILESITMLQAEQMNLFSGAFVHVGDKHIFKQVM